MKPTVKAGVPKHLSRLTPAEGFSTVEMVVALTVILIIGAIASPMLVRSVRAYQLNDSATRLADIVKLTRFEAIRKNKNADVRFQQNGSNWMVWNDSNINGTLDATETEIVLSGYADMLPAGVAPDSTPIAATLGAGGTLALNTVSGANGSIRFDARGAVVFPGAPTVYVFWLGNATDTSTG